MCYSSFFPRALKDIRVVERVRKKESRLETGVVPWDALEVLLIRFGGSETLFCCFRLVMFGLHIAFVALFQHRSIMEISCFRGETVFSFQSPFQNLGPSVCSSKSSN